MKNKNKKNEIRVCSSEIIAQLFDTFPENLETSPALMRFIFRKNVSSQHLPY